MLRLFIGNRLDSLLESLHKETAKSGSPLKKTTICVQTAGMQRWVGLELAGMAGISANLDFIFPAALIKRMAERYTGRTDLWVDKDELTWLIYRELLSLTPSERTADIIEYLRDDIDTVKTFRLAGRIADVFDQYQLYRPDMVLDWLSSPVFKDEERWQAELFRNVFPDRNRCKTHVLHRMIKDMEKTGISPLKETVHLFALSVIPPFFIDILSAASKSEDINLYLLNPSEKYWGDSISEKEISRREKRERKTAEEMMLFQNNPLLDNLGTLGRDFFDILLDKTDFTDDSTPYKKPHDGSILSSIQADIFSLSPIKEEERQNDGSITAASCHNPLREAESLYDWLLDLFNSDKELKPSDVLVMCTDVKTYAPYIRAVFDNPYSESAAIPYSIADLPGRLTSRPAGVFSGLLELITGEFNLASMIKVIGEDITAKVFGITRPFELMDILERNGALYAFDNSELEKTGVTADAPFTFRRAMQRIALGLAEGTSGFVYREPAGDNVPFSMADELGGLMRFTELCGIYRKRLAEEAKPVEWCAVLTEITDIFLSKDPAYADDLVFLTSCIAEIKKQTEKLNISIPSKPVIETLGALLDDTGGSKGFITGKTTFCAMLPMRSIPFRVICILGLNDSSFPRIKSGLEFDLIAKHPRKGDRTQRESDKYLFLETLISAREKLYLSYIGRSESDNRELVPSILVTELLRYLERRYKITDAVTHHRLHSFSRQYFSGGRLFTYSPSKYNAVRALAEKKIPKIFCPSPINAEIPAEADIASFERFFMNPPKYFLEKVMGIKAEVTADTVPETECMNLDYIRRYSLKSRALETALNGKDPLAALDYSAKLGTMPAGGLGEYFKTSIAEYGSNMAEAVREYLPDGQSTADIEYTCGGLTLRGRIAGTDGQRHIFTKIGYFKAKDITKAWIRHLLLNTASPVETMLISDENRIIIKPCSPDSILSSLVELFSGGHRIPLYFHPTDGFASVREKSSGVSEDMHSRIKSETAFKICFGTEERQAELIGTSKIIYEKLFTLADSL